MRKSLAVIVFTLLVTGGACTSSAQTTYTQSTPFACNQQVCNGLPLDQGGTWQFIRQNSTFSLSSGGFYIAGNPGSATFPGGIEQITEDTITFPNCFPYPCAGPEGSLAFTWKAEDVNGKTYTGTVSLRGHQVEHGNNHGHWYVLVVDMATITVNQ